MTAVYLVLGLALMTGLFYALTQITARQRRLGAELTRLERLAAEVAMNAEAILERVDERIDRLSELAVRAEIPAPVTVVPVAMATPATPVAMATPVAPLAPPLPTSIQKYQEARNAVWSLADQGLDAQAIARTVAIPRGEVQLLLNLRGRKASA